MGLFSRKDKSARASPAPQAAPSASSASINNRPYTYSPPPPSYISENSWQNPYRQNDPMTYDGYNGGSQSNTYGAQFTSYRPTTPETSPYSRGGPLYGDSKAPGPSPYDNPSYGGSRTPEPSYSGESSYGRSRTPEPSTYGGSRTPEPSTYGASIYNESRRPSTLTVNNPYGGPTRPSQNSTTDPDYYYSGRGTYSNYGSTTQDPYSSQQTDAMEEEDADIIKQEIRYTKQASHASTINSLRAAARAEQAGQETVLNLEQQGESLYNTQLNLRLAKTHGDYASRQAKDLKVANRPLFMPHINNPFSSGTDKIVEEQVVIQRHQRERQERSAAQKAHEERMRKMGMAPVGAPRAAGAGGGLAAKAARQKQSMYSFEADEEDDRLEDGINDNLEHLVGASGRLNMVAKTIQNKVEEQNKLIGDIEREAHGVEDGIVRTSHKLRPYGF